MGSYTENLFKNRKSKKLRGEHLVSVAIVRDGVIHKGFESHVRLRQALGDENPYESYVGDYEGFYTSADRFVDRIKARQIGELAGQCNPSARELISSDVDRWS